MRDKFKAIDLLTLKIPDYPRLIDPSFKLPRVKVRKFTKGFVAGRLTNFLRIHWRWIKDKKDYKEVAKLLLASIEIQEKRLKK